MTDTEIIRLGEEAAQTIVDDGYASDPPPAAIALQHLATKQITEVTNAFTGTEITLFTAAYRVRLRQLRKEKTGL